jgi:hypothetical protein
MRLRQGAVIATFVATVVASGCAAVLVRGGDDYHPESAYIYGRFRLDPDAGGGTAFSIRCRDGKRYKIVFSKDKDDALRMIRLPAGTCQLEDVIAKAVGAHREMAPFRLLNNEHLDPGGVYYVGDFLATVSSSYMGPRFDARTLSLYNMYRERWGLDLPHNNYAATTAAMKRAYPSFASVTTADRMARQ